MCFLPCSKPQPQPRHVDNAKVIKENNIFLNLIAFAFSLAVSIFFCSYPYRPTTSSKTFQHFETRHLNFRFPKPNRIDGKRKTTNRHHITHHNQLQPKRPKRSYKKKKKRKPLVMFSSSTSTVSSLVVVALLFGSSSSSALPQSDSSSRSSSGSSSSSSSGNSGSSKSSRALEARQDGPSFGILAGAPISNISVWADNLKECESARVAWTGGAVSDCFSERATKVPRIGY